MVTAVGGYPTRSWGSDGYGLECADVQSATHAVDTLHAAGAAVIKIPLNGGPELSEEALRAAVARAHQHGLKVVTHAMDDRSVRLAAAVGMDGLAHTPTSRLSDEAVAAWSGKAVISTLSAFGAGASAIDNLRRLKEAGAIVLYGTDLGNSRMPRIDPAELSLLAKAGLTGAEILTAGTSAPAAWWGLEPLGTLAQGRPASLLVLKADPTKDPATLANPAQVYIEGQRR
jgi:imidazolonepropionase-like amidohydrolase